MDTSDLFASCRKGDVGRVRTGRSDPGGPRTPDSARSTDALRARHAGNTYLLEQRDVEVNVRDKWDSTPLYYACLCGHEELVLYLLANGARCEANTFDGERCLYGALSDPIRRALRDYKQVTASCRRRDYYDDFLQRLLEQGIHSDVVFVVHGKPFRAHRCVLGARSAYFANMLDTKWKGKNVVVLRHPLINPVAFGALLQYLYTGRLDVGVEHVSDCERLAKQCQLWDLLSDLETKCEKVSEFVASKPGTCVKVLTIEPPPADPRLREDMALLADCALPPELRGDLGELPFPCPDGFNSCPDVCFRVEGCSFLCHKAFFCGRSDYFRALLDDHFRENEELEASGGLLAITLHGISPDIFTHVLYYIYSDHTEVEPSLSKQCVWLGCARRGPACPVSSLSLCPSKVWMGAEPEPVVSPSTGSRWPKVWEPVSAKLSGPTDACSNLAGLGGVTIGTAAPRGGLRCAERGRHVPVAWPEAALWPQPGPAAG
uniref:BTB domain-containing protein n=1 Tax=Canis lupus familiaris TaxID=9615 RepID=A0A8C0TYR4_CANLF